MPTFELGGITQRKCLSFGHRGCPDLRPGSFNGTMTKPSKNRHWIGGISKQTWWYLDIVLYQCSETRLLHNVAELFSSARWSSFILCHGERVETMVLMLVVRSEDRHQARRPALFRTTFSLHKSSVATSGRRSKTT